jgi:arsenate reductase
MKYSEKTKLLDGLRETIQDIDTIQVPEERLAQLAPLAHYIREKQRARQAINLLFICTHNSRRSHLSQIWAQALSAWYGFKDLTCYSGGTETTAMYPTVAQTLAAEGFSITAISAPPNTVYAVTYSETEHPVIAFSKEFGHSFNPSSGFAAVMTCSQADENCPFVPGAEKRFSLPYDDPKEYDGTPREAEMYRSRSRQIAAELMIIFKKALEG